MSDVIAFRSIGVVPSPQMLPTAQLVLRLVCALAIGFLIGAERERREGKGPQRSPAGVRTFTLASLVGSVSVLLGGNIFLLLSTGIFAAFSAVAYVRTHEQDPGLTSEAALVLTVLLGGLAQTQTATAARVRLHHFVADVIKVRSDPGGVYITRGSAPNVVVHATVRPLYGRLDLDIAEANIRALEQNPPIEQAGNHILIGFVKDPALLRAVTIRFDIQTPNETQVHARTESGGISIDGISGPIQTVTSSGRTEISNLHGKIEVTGESGSVGVRDCSGQVYIHNGSGKLQVYGVKGVVDADTTSGRIQISDVSGDVRATTHSATIRINKVTGTAEAHNSSGSIDALQSRGSVHAEATSGSIRITQLSPAPIRAVTRSGVIKVELATGGGYLLDAHSDSGRISGTNTTMLNPAKNTHNVNGQIGSGGPLVDLDSHSSKIVIN